MSQSRCLTIHKYYGKGSRVWRINYKNSLWFQERDTVKLIKETIDSTTSRRPDSATQQKLRELEQRANRSQVLATDFEQRYEQKVSELEEFRTELQQIQERYTAEVANNQRVVMSLNEEIDLHKKSKEELEEKISRQNAAGSLDLSGFHVASFFSIESDKNASIFCFWLQVFSLEDSPLDLAQKRVLEEAAKTLEENKVLQEKLNQIRSQGSISTDLTMNVENFLQGPGEQLEGVFTVLKY